MKKKRINLAEVFPKYFAASKRTEKFAELTDDQEVTLASVDGRIAELEEELTALKAGKAADEDEDEENTASDDDDEKKAADEDEEEMAADEKKDTDEPKAKVSLESRMAALESENKRMKAILDKRPAANGTVIDSHSRSEGGRIETAQMASSVDAELDRLLGISRK